MTENKNIDNLLTSVAAGLDPLPEPVVHAEPAVVETAAVTESPKEIVEESEYETGSDSGVSVEKGEEAASDIDEYGNTAQKAKMYTEEEVQRMIRERLSRGKHAEQHTQQQINQVQQQAQDFVPDPASEDAWEAQLESFIEKTLEKRTTKAQEQQWREQERRTQLDFESKFTAGMSKYSDFEKVVVGQPITDTMMLAVRSMKDPAAFIYAASKTQAKELERISRIPDRLQQAAEIGRLDVTMRKAKSAVSSAPKPLSVARGDLAGAPKRSIDDLIRIDAKNKFKR